MSSPMTYIIDDDAEALKSLEFLLKVSKISCQSFSSAAAFLEVVKELEAGCIVSDYHMPVMSGLELAEELEKIGINWPTILITGRSDFYTSADIISKKRMALLLKPYKNEDLLKAITSCKNSVRF